MSFHIAAKGFGDLDSLSKGTDTVTLSDKSLVDILDTEDCMVEEYTWGYCKEILSKVTINGTFSMANTWKSRIFNQIYKSPFSEALHGRLKCHGINSTTKGAYFGAVYLDDEILLKPVIYENEREVKICDGDWNTVVNIYSTERLSSVCNVWFEWVQKFGSYYLIELVISFYKGRISDGFELGFSMSVVINEHDVVGVFNVKGDCLEGATDTCDSIPKNLMAGIKVFSKWH